MRITAKPKTSPVSIINQVAEAEDQEVSLFLPEDSVFFADPANFQLLKRQAEAAGKQVTIITPDTSGKNKATEAGLRAVSPQEDDSFFASLEDALKQDQEKSEESQEPTETSKKVEQSDASNSSTSYNGESDGGLLRSGRIKWGLGGLAVLIALGWAFFFLPFASVTVQTQRDTVELNLSAQLDKSLSQANIDAKKLPAQVAVVQKEISLVSESTGFKDFNQKAQGSIIVYNEQSTPQSMIPSRFKAENGNIYWSQRNIQVPPRHSEDGEMVPGTLEVKVVAAEAGPSHNLTCSEENPCRLTVPAWEGTDKFEKVYAKTSTSLLGGEAGESKVVTESDLNVAKQVIREKGRKEALKALQGTVPEGFRFIQDSLEYNVSEIDSNKASGDMGEQFTTTAQLSARGFLVSKEALSRFIDTLVKADISGEKKTFPDSMQVSFSTESKDFEAGNATVNVSATTEAGWKLDKGQLKGQLAGKSLPEARRILLSEEKIDSAQVRLGPSGAFWVTTIPSRPSRINLEIK